MIQFIEWFIYYFFMFSPIIALILWIIWGTKVIFLKRSKKNNKSLLIISVIFSIIGAYVFYQMQTYGSKRSQNFEEQKKSND